MANPEHVALVRKGKDAIAEWRRSNPGVPLDLSGDTLTGVYLFGVDLPGANLSEANLADVHMSGVDLRRAILTRAKLSDTGLLRVTLIDADLVGIHLLYTSVLDSDLTNADLNSADFMFTNVFRSNFGGADLTGASLSGVNLNKVGLEGTNLSNATLLFTSLTDVDLSQVTGLGTVRHQSPNTVGVDTLMRSFRGAGDKLTPELRTFFQGAGVPRELLEALPGILAQVKYCTCFICYGQPDLAFATTLRQDLVARGVSCYLYEMDKTPGERIWHEIGMKRREAEKMVVLCSANALVRDGVLKEIEEQIDEDPDKMVPVSLDDLWTEPGFKVMRGSRDLKPFLMERNYADFAGWESDPNQYQRGLNELLRGLRRRDG